MKKLLYIFFVLLSVSIVAASVPLYMRIFFENESQPAQPVSPAQTATSTPQTDTATTTQPVDTAYWKTYLNIAHGITFLYPVDWSLAQERDSVKLASGNQAAILITTKLDKRSIEDYTSAELSRINEEHNFEGTSFSGWTRPEKLNFDSSIAVVQSASVVGISLKKIAFPEDGIVIMASFAYDAYTGISDPYLPRAVDALAQSLRRIGPLDTTDWKRFQNDLYGFTMRYPAHFAEYPSTSNSTRVFRSDDESISIQAYDYVPSRQKINNQGESTTLTGERWLGYRWESAVGGCRDVMLQAQLFSKNLLVFSFRTCGNVQNPITEDEHLIQTVVGSLYAYAPQITMHHISAVSHKESYALLLDDMLYEQGEAFGDYGQTLSESDIAALNKVEIMSYSKHWLAASEFKPRINSFLVSSDNKVIIFSQTDLMDRNYFATYWYDVDNRKLISLLQEDSAREANEPVALNISPDKRYVLFRDLSCVECDAGPQEHYVYNVEKNVLRKIGSIVEFNWLTADSYSYKPCTIDGYEGPGYCSNEASTTPAIIATW